MSPGTARRGCACRWSAGDLLWKGEEKVRESSAELSPIDCCLTACPRGLRNRPLGDHRSQRRRSSPLDSNPASGLTSLLVRKLRPMGHNASSFPDYREIHPYSQLETQEIRSLSKMQLHVSDLSASPRQGVQRENVRPSPNVSLCTHCHDGVVRPDTEHRTTWRERAILIQSYSSWGWPLLIKNGRGVMLHWTELHKQKGG